MVQVVARLDGQDVVLTAVLLPEQSQEAASQRLVAAFEGVVRELRPIRQHAVDGLLEDKNAHWLRPGESPWSAFELRARLLLRRLDLEADGCITLSFGCEEAFWGHEVTMGLDPQGRPAWATLEG